MASRSRARSTNRAWAVRDAASCSRPWRSSGVSPRSVTLARVMGAPPFARRPHLSYVRARALVLLADAPLKPTLRAVGPIPSSVIPERAAGLGGVHLGPPGGEAGAEVREDF